MADTRICEQCGRAFTPRREHARFCSGRCRAAWNREKVGDPPDEVNALHWSVTAMSDTTERLAAMNAPEWPHSSALIDETVWWLTIVDATLVRHHAEAYDAVLAHQTPAERRLIEGTSAGLRFVRNRIGDKVNLDEFVGPGEPGTCAGWIWKSVPEPALGSLRPRARSWELTRYRAYQAHLAGHTIAESCRRAVAFLELTAATAAQPQISARTPHLE